MEDILKSLNDEQIKPVLDTEGHVLVLAGAGSGKTRVLTSRIAYILDKKLAVPSQILAITFTNKAAGEMKERIGRMVGDTSEMWISTIHSMCSRILRSHGTAIGVQRNFSIYSETERANVVKKVIKEMNLGDERILKSSREHIAKAKSVGDDPETYFGKHRFEPGMREICDVYAAYEEHLSRNNALDFDDLLIKALELLRSDDGSRLYLSDKFKYVLVDEFQDTNAVQYEIIRLLASVHGNLFVVGDDDQSIYGWRGAEIKNILGFDRDFTDAKTYKLQRNYRSSSSILNLANHIIKNNASRHDKTLWTERGTEVSPVYYEAADEIDEADFVAKKILEGRRRGSGYSDFAVLLRINSLTRAFEQEFSKYAIPYKVFGGFRFYERREIKDMLAYMRLVTNPFDDEAFMRIVNVPRRGIGGKTLEVIDAYAAVNDTNLYYACLSIDSVDVFPAAKARIAEFTDFIKELVLFSQTETVEEVVKKIVRDTGIQSFYEDGTEDGDAKSANIDEFIASVEEFCTLNPTASLTDYLNQVTLTTTSDDMEEGEYVTIATIHAVKGLEFDEVFISGLEEGVMPISRATDVVDIEEERRLMYVAVTRAKSRLYLTRSRTRYLYGSREDTVMSVFLDEASDVMGDQIPRRRDSFLFGYGQGYGTLGNRGTGYGRGPGAGKNDAARRDYEKYGFTADDDSDAESKKNRTAGAGSVRGQVAAAKPAGKFEVGMRVEHKKFGPGTVVTVFKGGNNILVKFDSGSMMELSVSIAPLTVLP